MEIEFTDSDLLIFFPCSFVADAAYRKVFVVGEGHALFSFPDPTLFLAYLHEKL